MICKCEIVFISLHSNLFTQNAIFMNERDKVVKIMECEGLNAKQFATEIGVSAGTISNIMSGRNKPSLEVMQAILRRFRTINCWWLFGDIGSMYLTTPIDNAPRLPFPEEETGKSDSLPPQGAEASPNVTPVPSSVPSAAQQTSSSYIHSRTVSKIVIFYSDGTFEER